MTAAVRTHTLSAERVHYAWDNRLAPVLEVEPGDRLVVQTRDASDGYYSPASTAEDVRRKPAPKGHPLSGPVFVRGARPGDVLEVAIEEVRTAPWGWTAVYPGRGLLPDDDFVTHHIRIWDLSDGRAARWGPEFAVPIEPFCGVMGVALDEPGEHSTLPPRRNGGNMDVKQLRAGTTLYLPVLVPGALFSVGDAHAAQGDGEVCITAIETSATVTLRLGLRRDFTLREPQLLLNGPLLGPTNAGPWYGTTAHGPDLLDATKRAVRYLIEYLVERRGFTPLDAYVLASVAADLKISEVVDAPNWIVSAFLPLSIFERQA